MHDTITGDRAGVRVGASSLGGRGVFACTSFEADDPIDECAVLVVAAGEADTVCRTILGHYAFAWDEDGSVALALGAVSLLNHSDEPNAYYERGQEPETIVVYARQPIDEGDEILIDYTGGGALTLWFTPA
jgi:hypothetical protein